MVKKLEIRNHGWLGGNRETSYFKAPWRVLFHNLSPKHIEIQLTYIRRLKSFNQSLESLMSFFFTLVPTFFYRFIDGRPTGSPNFSYECATHNCTSSRNFLSSKVGSYITSNDNYCVNDFYLLATLT